MAVTALPFAGPTFFHDVRTRLQVDRGMFVGSDGAYRYVCVDPGFYRLGVFVRPPALTFTASAAAASSTVRAVANGPFFSTYHYFSPGPVPWLGEVISGGTVLPGGGAAGSGAKLRHAGQWPGTSVPAVAFGRGSPSSVVPPLRSAVGGLLPLITAGAPATAAQLGSWMSTGARVGKTVYGLLRVRGRPVRPRPGARLVARSRRCRDRAGPDDPARRHRAWTRPCSPTAATRSRSSRTGSRW